MTMFEAGVVILVIAFSAVGILWVLPTYRRYRGKWVVTCPDSRNPTGVKVDVARVAATAWRGDPDLKLKDCSRWPEKAGCGQECLAEIERDVKAINAGWYRCQSCALCGSPIPGALADIFSTQKPVCWDCHVALSVARERPGLPALQGRTQAYG